jgi:hypothetical protein
VKKDANGALICALGQHYLIAFAEFGPGKSPSRLDKSDTDHGSISPLLLPELFERRLPRKSKGGSRSCVHREPLSQ